MRVFLTGASGYVGSAVGEELAAAGHEVVALARSEAAAAWVVERGWTALRGNLREAAGLRAAAEECEAVVHAGIEWGPEAGFVDRIATEALLSGLEGSGKAFVYTSGIWVYGDTGGRLAGELQPREAPERVAWRPAVEDLVLEAKERGVKGMVLRLGRVYGRGGGALKGLFAEARAQGEVSLVGDGRNHWSCIHLDDLVTLYRLALERPRAGEAFIACTGQPQPAEKIARAVCKACGLEARVRLIAVEEARKTMGSLAECLALDCRTGSTKAARYFGWPVKKPSIFEEILGGSYLPG